MITDNIEDLKNLVSTSPIAICVIDAATLVAEMLNDAFVLVGGKPYDAVYGKYYWDAFPEAAPYYEADLARVIKEGTPFHANEVELMLVRQGKEEWVFVTFVYMPLKTKEGQVTKVVIWVIENTARVKERHTIQELNEELTAANEEMKATNEELGVLNEELAQTKAKLQQLNGSLEDKVEKRTQQLAANEVKFRTVVDKAPLALGIFKGRELIIEICNQRFLDIIYKTKSIIGKPLLEAIPELKGQPAEQVLLDVYTTGKPFYAHDYKAMLQQEDGTKKEGYYDLIYQPFTDEDGDTSIIGTAVEVTERTLARQRELQLMAELSNTNEELLQTQNNLQQLNESLESLVKERTHLLTESEANLQLAIQSADLGMWTLDLHTQQVVVSDQYRQMFGLPMEGDIVLEQIIQATEPNDVATLNNAISDAISQNKKVNLQYRIRHGITGELRWIKGTGKVIADAAGKPVSIIGMNMNITEQVHAFANELALNEELAASNEELASTNEELQAAEIELLHELKERTALSKSLAEREAWFRNLIKQAPVAIALFSGPNFIIELYNERVLEYWNRTAEQVDGVPLFTALPEASGQGFEELLTNVLKTGERYVANELPVTLIRNGNLDITWINFIYDPVRDAQGNIEGIIVVCSEITEQVNARKKTEEAEERLQLAIDATELGIWSVDLSTQQLTLTPRSRHIHGLPDTAAITLPESFKMIDEGYRQQVEDAINFAVENHSVLNTEYLIHPMDGSASRWLRATGKCTYDSNQAPLLITGMMLDITEQKKDDERKNDFIGMVSHEMKTPLTSMSAYIQLLQMKTNDLDSFGITMLDKAGKQIIRMTTLINGFLNVSRLESGKIQVDRQLFDMADLVKEEETETSATISTHQFVFHPVEYTQVNADKDKIAQVINNLISNAAKYSPKGSTIHIACVTINKQAQVSVKDEGIGIAPEDMEKLFDRYYRVENKLSKTISGFGIGLYLCAEIVRRHDGKIWVDSEVGRGSTFYFSLPVV